MAWGNRVVELQKMNLIAHWILAGEEEKLGLPEGVRLVDVLEELFALLQSLFKAMQNERKALLDKRLRPQAEEASGASLITAEDLKVLEKVEKLRRAFPSKGKGGKGGRWQPYSRPNKGKSWGKGKGKGAKGSAKFGFMQTPSKQNVQQQPHD